MFNRNKRILWILNHRTLMPYEAPLIQRLGFEIFIPKIYPKTGFRSFTVDASYDATLSLPADVLEVLNGFNFYEDEWTPEISTLTNRYFGCAFVIPHAPLLEEAVDHFEGQIVLRAFGLDNERTYKGVIEELCSRSIMRKIEGIKERFWFGEGYDHLHEAEEPLFVERALFLPIGIPDSFFSTAHQWIGTEKKILFFCPNAVTDAYYSKVYREFKRDFGDLPHVVVGAQDVPVDDPHVAGSVSDAELKRLYLECGVLYYHSTEVRHVHYSPIEAAINGMPVVYRAGSLLDRLSRGSTKGRVESVAEARSLIQRVLSSDASLIAEIKGDQEAIAFHFSDAYCGPMWHEQMERRGFYKAMSQPSLLQICLKEAWRTVIKPWAHGRTKINPHRRALAPLEATLTAEEARDKYGSSLYDGIRFASLAYPAVVHEVDGIGDHEAWGRWSSEKKIVIVLKHKLEGRFRLYVHAFGYRGNAGVPVAVRIGSQTRMMHLAPSIEESHPVWLHFDLAKPANIIEITVPHPTRPEMDTRTVGIGMVEICAMAAVTASAVEARSKFGASMEDGIDFACPTFPAFVELIYGVYTYEHWGRWSSGTRVTIELKHLLQGRFKLLLRAVAYGPNVGVAIAISIGSQRRSVRLPGKIGPDDVFAVDFDLKVGSNTIEFAVPHPTCPPGDTRELGIGFYSMRIELESGLVAR